jgi:hypothetical protein
MSSVGVSVEIPVEDLAYTLVESVWFNKTSKEELMKFILRIEDLLQDDGFTAELQAKLSAALMREDAPTNND